MERAPAPERPDLVARGGDQLRPIERLSIEAIRRTFEPGPLDRAMRYCQRNVGSRWIVEVTRNLLHVHGLDRLPPLDPTRSYVCASNHRSFFDLYVITGYLVRHGLPHRLVFPVRSEFFYDHPLGPVVNGLMSFFAMYPPIFRDRARAPLNLVGLDELAFLLRRGGTFLGIHPEGTRKKDDDPYTLLPAQPGVGRIVHRSAVTVLPVFVNGLLNDLPKQVTSNYDGSGRPVHLVFGRPVALDDLLAQKGSPRVFRAITERICDDIVALGAEERGHRAAAEKRRDPAAGDQSSS
ncbi:MAG: 1-acyl-sn-glycerol-3-phosphate acyltransferase [Deltaproteobacteria bacterium]|nr:1-acyl-sn-glycerol-3-phosphate acyltransferase [Deltaproteobacteria bacterium]